MDHHIMENNIFARLFFGTLEREASELKNALCQFFLHHFLINIDYVQQ